MSFSHALAQDLFSRRFALIQPEMPYSCALQPGEIGLRPAVRKGQERRVRLVGQSWSSRQLAMLREQRREAARIRSRSRRAAARSDIDARIRIVQNFSRRCSELAASLCSNNRFDTRIEDGVDCGDACGVSCGVGVTPTPQPSISPTPLPLETIAPTPTPTPSPTQTPPPVLTEPPDALNDECFDGLDNDSDGLIDLGGVDISRADFGCFGPNAQESQIDYGFTQFSPSSDTKFVYVSSSEGDDSNDGLSARTPKLTLNAAYALLRNGHPDWLLLKRGDVFNGSDYRQRLGRILGSNVEGDYAWTVSGRSAQEPILISSYGVSTERPVLIIDNAPGANSGARTGLDFTNVSYVTVSGLDFYAAPCDPNSPRFSETGCGTGIRIYSRCEHIRIEDNRIRFFGSGITVQAANDPPNPPRPDQRWNDVFIHRNVISDSYHSVAHSQGIYAASEGRLKISENILYRNGWNADIKLVIRPAPFNRDVWRSIADGRIRVTINGTTYPLQGLNFSTVNTYADVAAVIESALRGVTPPSADVRLGWNGRAMILRAQLPSNDNYGLSANVGSGTNLALSAFLNVFSGNPTKTSADIYNRNMYLTQNRSNYTVEGNLVSRGASGGIQLRMGGILRGNVALAEPVGMSVGHAQNYGEQFTAYIADNVVLGASNMGAAGYGFGIGFAGQGFLVERNIIAHNEEGTENVEGLFSDTDDTNARELYRDGELKNNIVYNWKSPNGRGAALALRHDDFSNIAFENNSFIQPFGGSVIGYRTTAPLVGLLWGANTVFAANTGPGVPLFSIQSQAYNLSQFANLAGGAWSASQPAFPAPQRTISSYLADKELGGSSVDDFMLMALTQSRWNWTTELSAQGVRRYIQEGFGLE